MVGALIFLSHLAWADDLDPLQKTQMILTDPMLRQKAAAGDPKAASAVQNASLAVGNDPRHEQELFTQASDIFSTLLSQAKGDPARLQALIDALQRDPASLEKSLTARQLQSVRVWRVKSRRRPSGPRAVSPAPRLFAWRGGRFAAMVGLPRARSSAG